MRAVVDTNVWLSALVGRHGIPRRILTAAHEERFEAVVSPELIHELRTAQSRRSMMRAGLNPTEALALVVVLESAGNVFDAADSDAVVPMLRDPTDQFLITLAVAGEADCVVSGDKDILEDATVRAFLGERGIAVYTPREFAEVLGLMESR